MALNIVVVGGGFAGLWAAAAAARMRDELDLADTLAITLVAPSPFHIIRVRCYEADLTPLRVPLDDILAPIGVRRVEGSVTEVAAARHAVTVQLTRAEEAPVTLPYDRLILAPGSVLHRPPVPGVEGAFDVDTIEGAQTLATHLDRLGDGSQETERPGRWTAVVIGGGLVGLELACELPGRLAASRDRAGETGPVQTFLIDRAADIGLSMGPAALPAIRQALASAGVVCVGSTGIRAIDRAGVILDDGTRIPALTVICATGMQASPLAAQLGVPRDVLGRLPVDQTLRVTGLQDIYAAGDVATALADEAGHRTVMSCQHARPMGRFAGHNAVCDLAWRSDRLLSFSAPDYVTVLDLGAWGAVYTSGWDRGELVSAGASAKATKRIINGSRIYPPRDRDRAAILAAAAPVIQAAPAVPGPLPAQG